MSGDVVCYAHYRADDGIMFYIGIGNRKRPYSTRDRSDWWKKTEAKHGLVVEVLQEELTWDQACELERVMIAEWRNAPDWLGRLTNIMDGGEGAHGELWLEKLLAVTSSSEWKAAHAEGSRKRAMDSNWRISNAEAMKKRTADPSWQINVAKGVAKMVVARATNPEWRANCRAAKQRTPYQQRLHLFELMKTDEAKATRRLRRWNAKYMGWAVA